MSDRHFADNDVASAHEVTFLGQRFANAGILLAYIASGEALQRVRELANDAFGRERVLADIAALDPVFGNSVSWPGLRSTLLAAAGGGQVPTAPVARPAGDRDVVELLAHAPAELVEQLLPMARHIYGEAMASMRDHDRALLVVALLGWQLRQDGPPPTAAALERLMGGMAEHLLALDSGIAAARGILAGDSRPRAQAHG